MMGNSGMMGNPGMMGMMGNPAMMSNGMMGMGVSCNVCIAVSSLIPPDCFGNVSLIVSVTSASTSFHRIVSVHVHFRRLFTSSVGLGEAA
jgi:hypothetical protein